jgi:ATP-binding protein involved in chromosome partitioning
MHRFPLGAGAALGKGRARRSELTNLPMKSYFDVDGDGGSRVLEQVLAQRARIARNLAGVRRLLVVASGKGGVGKSTLSLRLAVALAKRGQAVAVLDADLNGPSQARLAGVGSVPLLPGAHGMVMPRARLRDGTSLGVVSLGSLVPEHQALDFASVAAGEEHTWRATREMTLFGELLAAVEWGQLDTLVVDLPPGAERTAQFAEALGPEAAFVLVTLPSQLARGVVARSLAALRRLPNPLLGYVENMSGYWCAACGALRPLFPAETGDENGPTTLAAPPLDLPCLGQIPFDPALAAACDRGELEASGPVGAALEAIAARLLALLAAAPTATAAVVADRGERQCRTAASSSSMGGLP